MIQIHTRRAGLVAIAATVHDDHSVTMTVGLTQESARRRLHRRLDRGVRP